uniref:Uncharacterized protein n=1 Tax=Ditylenchus dipsaci TaxID=166011 RepID=A0A915D2U5_9BILA
MLLNIFILSFAQTTSFASPTEVISNGRVYCPAADSQDYQLIPYITNRANNFMATNITSISIVPAGGGPAIEEFPYNRSSGFAILNPTPPYNCDICYEPIRMSNHTPIVRDIVALFNGTYYDDTNDGRVGEWVITSEHIAIVRPVFNLATSDPNLCDFFLAPYYINNRITEVVLGHFPARHYCLTRNTAEQKIGLAGASFIP